MVTFLERTNMNDIAITVPSSRPLSYTKKEFTMTTSCTKHKALIIKIRTKKGSNKHYKVRQLLTL